MSEAKARLHEVEIRFVRSGAGDSEEARERARTLLGAQERLALARIQRAEERRDFLAAHALARRMLARAAGCLPSELRLRLASNGRLEVAAPAAAVDLRLSVSHADGIALCAVARARMVGAYVASSRTLGPVGIATSLGSLREQQALRTLTAGRRIDDIASLWTLKEAVAKAAGHQSSTSRACLEVGDAVSWRVAVWRLTQDHFVAVAVPGGKQEEGLVMRCEEEGERSSTSLRDRAHVTRNGGPVHPRRQITARHLHSLLIPLID
jgi:phosphopantetheinyl transferase